MKTYFITGANRGIGLELTKQLLAKENKVFVGVKNFEKNSPLGLLKIQYAQNLKVFSLDVRSIESVTQLKVELGDQTQVDVLINNAGIYPKEDEDFLHFDEENVWAGFETNSIGPMRVTWALLPSLMKSQLPVVAHMSSKMGSISDNNSGGHYAYRMSKAALNMFSKSFAIDYSKIISLVFHPGWVQTDMGGPQALITAENSVHGLINLLEKCTLKDSGKFLDYNGKEILW